MDYLYDILDKKWENSDDKAKEILLKNLLEQYSSDHFRLFNVSASLSAEQIKATIHEPYKKLALILHPDQTQDKSYKNPALELFKLVSIAYETLTDPQKKQDYVKQQLEPQTSSNQPKRNFGTPGTFFNGAGDTSNFSSRSSTSPSSGAESHQRDIEQGEVIWTASEDIVIVGNIYGIVYSTHGSITVTGDVFGTLKNTYGDIKVVGNIAGGGTVTNTHGTNAIEGMVKAGAKVCSNTGNNRVTRNVNGTVKTNTGNNIIEGTALGTVVTKDGKNTVSGKVVPNQTIETSTGGISTSRGNVHVSAGTGSGNVFYGGITVIGSINYESYSAGPRG